MVSWHSQVWCWLPVSRALWFSLTNKLAQAHAYGSDKDIIALRGQVSMYKAFKLLHASNLPLFLLAKANKSHGEVTFNK